jgi:formylglycine-generating enzyme required for sulfatase activity
MGVVYQARQSTMNRQVVVKVINRALLDHPDAAERFRREVEAAARLSHPNIVTAYDAEQAGDLHLLVMEFVPGKSLAEFLEKKGPLPIPLACHFTRQAALGLQHASEQGMVHRDIKPANLMVTPKGLVKVLDFGLAKLASERGQGKGLTSTGAFMGTPDYCAPEQATDARSADIRADIYGLGCTLYCLLAGRPPFQEGTDVLTIFAHLTKEPPPLPEVRPDVPPELWAVIARMLAKDPVQRPQTPAEVARALAPFCKQGEGRVAAPTSRRAAPARQVTMPAPGGRLPAGSTRPAEAPPFEELLIEPARPAPRAKAKGPKAGGLRWGLLAAVVPLALAAALGLILLPALYHRLGDAGQQAHTGLAAQGSRAEVPRPRPLDCTGPDGASAAEVKRAQEAWAKYLGREVEETVEVADGVRMTFVLVPPGKFLMGSPANEEGRGEDESQHAVALTEPLDLGQTEVTQAQYRALTGSNPSQFQGDDLPVEMVSWVEASGYAAQLTIKRGDHHLYRLPTEAEWEYACRGGRPASQPFGIGDGTSLSSDLANCDGNFPYGGAGKGPRLDTTRRVGSYPANALGLRDMHGNVWEWCADWYGPYPHSDVVNPQGPSEGSRRVDRGCSWRGPLGAAAWRSAMGTCRAPGSTTWGSAWPVPPRPAASEAA